ncbi:MAG TPA: carboxypeptidase-like regulatory domain-containing protein [Pyrinomonadaceae bacterium]|nr:carboxypeptidase-like regulatory domain-containing protein [Pyrinomonadaceae bacterium]
MPSRTVSYFFSLILIISIVASTPGQAAHGVTGSVTDPLSVPIPGAEIRLYSLERILQTTSDSSGRFEFDAVPNGKYEFEVLAQGFKRFTRPDVSVTGSTQTAKQDHLDLTARMEIASTGSPIVMAPTDIAPPGACGQPESVTYGPRKSSDEDAVAGIVINLYPKMPIAGATLQLLDASGAQIARQQTNARGEFQFKQIAPGPYRIAFQHPGYNSTESFEFWVARENATYITMQAVQRGKFVVCQ